ncbi:reverse transcriptase [Phytophthora megakarya]|uniref:Reverse transcriptase n=1 Tax=Phytophthora megakarya TaxID=4795 RepID=A0A225VVX7_9STRA|nr:reverse transcriptase [Phytophthora megakarya]
MAYRPQGNGKAERTVQTLTRALKIRQPARLGRLCKRLTFALNTAHDRVRGETSFFLVHGWGPQSTLEAVVSVGSTRCRDCDARRWKYHIQGQYRRARKTVTRICARRSSLGLTDTTKTLDLAGLRKAHRYGFTWNA